jgi:hypothetical protein
VEVARRRRRDSSAASKRIESGVDMHYIVVGALRQLKAGRAHLPRNVRHNRT